jgi:hypothetical protein
MGGGSKVSPHPTSLRATAGYGGANERTRTLAFRWDGRRWRPVGTPTGGYTATIEAVTALPDGTAIIAGTTPNSSSTEYRLRALARPSCRSRRYRVARG